MGQYTARTDFVCWVGRSWGSGCSSVAFDLRILPTVCSACSVILEIPREDSCAKVLQRHRPRRRVWIPHRMTPLSGVVVHLNIICFSICMFFFFLPTVPHGNQRCGYVESRVYATATIAAQAAWLGVTGRDVKGIWSKKDIKCQYEKSLQFLSVTSPVFFSNTRLSSWRFTLRIV